MTLLKHVQDCQNDKNGTKVTRKKLPAISTDVNLCAIMRQFNAWKFDAQMKTPLFDINAIYSAN